MSSSPPIPNIFLVDDILNTIINCIECLNGWFKFATISKFFYEVLQKNENYVQLKCLRSDMIKKKISATRQNRQPFDFMKIACKLDNMICKVIYEQNQWRINLKDRDDILFRTACRFGSLNVVKWLYKLTQDDPNDIIDRIYNGFYHSIIKSKINVAAWFVNKIKDPVDKIKFIRQYNDRVIRVCE